MVRGKTNDLNKTNESVVDNRRQNAKGKPVIIIVTIAAHARGTRDAAASAIPHDMTFTA